MPKTKRSSAAKKRFKVTGAGKLLRRHAMKSHNLEKKSAKRRRSFRKGHPVSPTNGLSYNQFVAGLRKADIALDRKVLADLAVNDPAAFGAIAAQAKAALET